MSDQSFRAEQALQARVDEWRALSEQLEESYEDLDPKTLSDTLDGEIDLDEAIGRLDEIVLDREAFADAVKLRADTLAARAKRLSDGTARLKLVILQAMEKAGKKSVTVPTGTFTVKRTAPKLSVTEEADIPAQYWKEQDPKLDKKALTDALKDGAEVAGATLDNGGITLQVRRG